MPEVTVRKLPRRYVEKVWGVETLPDMFSPPVGKRIGEVHFEPPAEMPQLLVKHIFTSERLSVQNHPDDQQAAASGKPGGGKSECWLITAAEPGATIGIGFSQPTDRETMRAAALDGSIVDLIAWHEVRPGDFFYIPANTVHAIGAGVGLIEIQQNSDITYRLFDYGRDRELHLDEGLAIADGAPYPASYSARLTPDACHTLASGPHFDVTVISGPPPWDGLVVDGPALVVPIRGASAIDDTTLTFGDCAWAGRLDRLRLSPDSQALIARPRA